MRLRESKAVTGQSAQNVVAMEGRPRKPVVLHEVYEERGKDLPGAQRAEEGSAGTRLAPGPALRRASLCVVTSLPHPRPPTPASGPPPAGLHLPEPRPASSGPCPQWRGASPRPAQEAGFAEASGPDCDCALWGPLPDLQSFSQERHCEALAWGR